MLTLDKLNKKFGKKLVLNNISFAFESGVYGLLGPNGAGKTTLMRCISTNYPVKNGEILFNGSSINKDKTYLSKIGYLPQKFGMFKELKVFEALELMANLKSITKKDAEKNIDDCLEKVNLTDRKNSFVKTLSGGMVRRLGIAQALLGDPEIIIFDEPTAGLDPEERLRFKNIVSELDKTKTVIISTHIVEDVEAVCNKVAVMKDGDISVCGSCEEIQRYAENKVFTVRKDEADKINGKFEIQKIFEQDGVQYQKILSGSPQKFPAVSPNVEDGYICILKDI